MILPHRWLATTVLAAALVILVPKARGLVTLEDGRDQVFVTGTVAIAYDSNVFTNSNSGGSVTYSGTFGIEFVRRAGWIGVNAGVTWTITDFASYSSQNFADPAFTAEFDKQTGRTTGALNLSAQRQNRADVDVNTRDVSWNYAAGLTARYPVIERYSLAGGLNYGYTDYQDQKLFTNLSQYSANLDLYYILSDERDLFGGYRYRYSESSGISYDVDHELFVGVSGRIIPQVNGSLQVGYEIREPYSHDGTAGGTEGDWTASGSATWNLDRKTSLTGDISKDFGTTATAVSTDTTSGTLTGTYAYNAKLSLTAGVGAGETKFMGDGGRIRPGGPERLDYYFTWNAGINYTFNQHLKLSFSYTYYRNWSNLALAAFPRQQWTITATSRF